MYASLSFNMLLRLFRVFGETFNFSKIMLSSDVHPTQSHMMADDVIYQWT